MALISEPIAVAAATATVFRFPVRAQFVLVAVAFYDSNGAILAASTGTRDITISAVSTSGTTALVVPITGATVTAQPERAYKSIDLGASLHSISISCAAATDPVGATHYRIWVEGVG
jgi:hypothetical protein